MNNPLLNSEGLPRFSQITPEHVEPALQETLTHNRAAIEKLLSSGHKDFEGVVVPLEEMRNRLHRTWSPVSHLHMVANSDALRASYNRCLPLLSRYETEIAQDARLFSLLLQVEAGLPADETGPRRVLLDHALRDFRLAGVALPPAQKTRFGEVMEELAQLQAKFEQNLLDSMASWVHHETKLERLAGMPAIVVDAAAAAAKEQSLEGWLLRLDGPTYMAVLTHADDAELRKKFYTAWVTRASDQGPDAGKFDNSEVMERIMALRHEAAGLVGFPSYAHYALALRMADSPAEVSDFLWKLVTLSKKGAQEELAALEAFAGRPLQSWDIAWYAEKLRLEKFCISDAELRPYFPLPRVLQGLFSAIQQLYGVRIEAVEGIDVWNPQTRYYRLTDQNGMEIGGFFTDLYARRNKRAGAWMDECVIRKNLGGRPQLPVAHLVCNFTMPAPDQPTLLTHDDVVTLFHECGHTLHHLLTRVDYPSISGINGVPWDAVELPSQFMENFAWDPQVLRELSGHYATGAPLPDVLIERLQASKVFQAGMQMLRQLEFAIFDWRIHAEYDPVRGAHIQQTLSEVRDAVSVLNPPEFSRTAHGFAHVFGGGYAAGYYSYKWAEVLAADAFAAFQEQGLFNTELAAKFRGEILEVGGSRDIGAAFRAFRGRDASIEPLLRQAGLLQSDRPAQ